MSMHRPGTLMAGLVLALQSPLAHAADDERGQLLYENHCGGCHDSKAHIRERRKAQSKVEIFQWVHRWSVELELLWGPEEIQDVTGYLNRQFYRFDADS